MALFFRRAASVALIAGLFAGGLVAMPSNASAQSLHRFHGPFGPGFRGRVWFRPGFGWYRPYGVFPFYAYYGVPYVYYPPVYPRYVVPSAAYVMPPPRPAMAVPAQPREFVVYFDFDKYNLTPEARRVVDDAVVAARAGGPARIEVTGNTDLAGTNPYNFVLSRRRAETVRNYMVARGIDAGEIRIDAHGKTEPAIRTADGVREPRNRRVEIVITPEGAQRQSAPPPTSMMAPPPPPYGRPIAPVNATNLPPPPAGQPTNLINNQ
jgi:outer membrane protein OmpA-like peptidoglycan-associated protein